MATEREQRAMDAARAMVRDQDAGRPLTPALLALVGAVTAKDGTVVAKCMTHDRAAAIVAAAEKIRAELDAPMCDTCGKPATCGGSYERERAYACDDCCGHGNEDGHCEPVGDAPAQGAAQ